MRIACTMLAWTCLAASAGADDAVAWPSGPMEVRVAFDVARSPGFAARLVGRTIGFEALDGPRHLRDVEYPLLGRLNIAGARLEDGGRTLVLATDPHPRDAVYNPPIIVNNGSQAGLVLYTLAGVEATWVPAEGEPRSSWLPNMTFPPSARLTAISMGHDRFVADTAKPGKLTLRGLFVPPKGKSSLALSGASGPFEVDLAGASAISKPGVDGLHAASLEVEGDGEAGELVVRVTTGVGGKPARIEGPEIWTTLGWAPAPLPTSTTPPAPPFPLAGGDPAKGEAVFRSETAKCATCHRVGEKGGTVGPALDSQAGKDLAAIYQSIAEPSAAIHPDYVPYTVAMKGGKVAVGVVRAEGEDKLKIADINAQATVYDKSDVEELRPSATSIMPVGLAGAIGEAGMRDLLAYLSRKP